MAEDSDPEIPNSILELPDIWWRYTDARKTGKSPATLKMYDWVATHIERCPYKSPTESQAIYDWLSAKIRRNQVPLSPELISTFLKYWRSLVATDHRSDISLLFVHLTGDKFWHLSFYPDSETATSKGLGSKGVTAVRRIVEYASLDPELFQILQDPGKRVILLRVLIDSWFSGESSKIEQLSLIDEFESVKSKVPWWSEKS